MKKRILVCGIIMNCAGTEKSFLSFANQIDYDKYDVDLLLAEKTGLLLDYVPKQINIIEMPKYGDMFTLSGANAASVIWRDFVKENPLTLFEILPYAMKMVLNPKKKSDTAMRMWCHFLQKFPEMAGEYDICLAYWGDKSMFYMADKVKAKRKIAWLHFDYANPPRDDELYLGYFKKCDNIVTVSEVIDASLKGKFPEIADRCVMMENINDPALIRDMALRGDTFPDAAYRGLRVLSVGRISHQKAYDTVVPALARLRAEGFDFRFYILGGGDEADVNVLKEMAVDAGVADMLILLGTTANPYTYMRDCDIYIQPSRHEGKPIAVEEAKILLCPIIVSRYLSADEQMAGGELGMVTDIGTEGVYSALKKMLSDKALRDSYSDRLSKIRFGNASEFSKFEDMVSDL